MLLRDHAQWVLEALKLHFSYIGESSMAVLLKLEDCSIKIFWFLLYLAPCLHHLCLQVPKINMVTVLNWLPFYNHPILVNILKPFFTIGCRTQYSNLGISFQLNLYLHWWHWISVNFRRGCSSFLGQPNMVFEIYIFFSWEECIMDDLLLC